MNSIFVLALSLLLSTASFASENKIDITGGVFNLTGSNSKSAKQTAITGVGAYEVRYRRAITKHLDLAAGYSLYFKEVATGDSIYGLDLALIYFPWSASESTESKGDQVSLTVTENFRPFLAGSFVQRNFQGIQTTYTGFCAGGGFEYALTAPMSFITYARYASLSAGEGATASELVISSGFVFGF